MSERDNFDPWSEILFDEDDRSESDIHLSQSTVNNMDLCPAREGYRGSPLFVSTPSLAMSFGSMAHGAIEHDLKDGRLSTWTADRLEDIWIESLLNEREGSWDLGVLIDAATLERSLDEAVEMMRKWQKRVYPTLSLLPQALIEERRTKLLGVVDGRRVWFGGTADVVDPSGLIIDWKTASRGWDQSRADATGQAAAYSWLYGITSHLYWVWDRSKRRWDSYATTRNGDQVESYLMHAYQRARQIAYGIYPATPWQSQYGKYKRAWYCSAKWCPAWEACEMKFLNDDVWEPQEIDVQASWR